MDKYSDGKMETDDFIKTFKIAFPERPDEKIQKLAVNMSNKDGKICKQFIKNFYFMSTLLPFIHQQIFYHVIIKTNKNVYQT